MRKTISVFPQRTQPRAAYVEEDLWFQGVMISAGMGWQVMSNRVARKWVKHFPFVRKSGKVALARKFQIHSQVIEK